MTTKDFIQLLENKNAVANIDLQQFDSIIESFPYFQSAKILYLKNLKINNNFKFNSFLKETAAYAGDRTVLFEYITQTDSVESTSTENKTEKASTNIVDEGADNKKQEALEDNKQIVKPVDDKKQSVEDSDNVNPHKTLSFTKDDKFSFNEWLQLSNVREIHRAIDDKIAEKNDFSRISNKQDNEKKNKFDLIDKFIDNKPKLRPTPKEQGTTSNIALASTKENEGWMTETLTQVYIEQKKYSKAIKAYKILGLKYPEKSGFFADQIRLIKKMAEH